METSLLSKPRIQGPLVKIFLEVYHAIYPFRRKSDDEKEKVSTMKVIGSRVLLLFFVYLRWYKFLKDLIKDKKALNAALTNKEKLSMLIGICGHLLVIFAQKAVTEHEEAIDHKHRMNLNGPFSVIRHPHRVGKWISDSSMAIYLQNKVNMAISCVMLFMMVKNANVEENEYKNQRLLQEYKQKVPDKFVPYPFATKKEP